MNIRPIKLEEASALAALHALCFIETEKWDDVQIAGSLSLETTLGFLAEEGGEILGFLLAQKAQEEVEILTFCVRPDRRRQGTGRALVRRLLETAKAEAFFLEVAADNKPAQLLYESLGFVLFGRRPRYYRRTVNTVDALNYRYLVNG